MYVALLDRRRGVSGYFRRGSEGRNKVHYENLHRFLRLCFPNSIAAFTLLILLHLLNYSIFVALDMVKHFDYVSCYGKCWAYRFSRVDVYWLPKHTDEHPNKYIYIEEKNCPLKFFFFFNNF